MSDRPIIVGMADLKVTKDTGILMTIGLGSCLGIALYDPVAKVSGLAHAMLPNSKEIENNSNMAKFVDLASVKLAKDMIALGAKQTRIVAKIAGGAQMFAFSSSSSNMRIGDRNIEAAEIILKRMGVRVVAKDVGKTFGRTITLDVKDGKLKVKTVEHGTYFI